MIYALRPLVTRTARFSSKGEGPMNVERDLQRVKIAHLDLSDFATVTTGTTVAQVLQIMRQKRLSAVLILRCERLVGIFTERDVLTRVADDPASWERPVDEYMTGDPKTASPDESVGQVLRFMNAGHYRNMPVIEDDGRPLGNLTHHALIRFLTDHFPREIYNLPPDPDLIPRTREGA